MKNLTREKKNPRRTESYRVGYETASWIWEQPEATSARVHRLTRFLSDPAIRGDTGADFMCGFESWVFRHQYEIGVALKEEKAEAYESRSPTTPREV